MPTFRLFSVALACAAALLAVSATAGGAGLGPVKTSPGLASELATLDSDAP